MKFTSSAARPSPAGPRAAAVGQVQRLEVTRDTTAAGLLRELARWDPVAPRDAGRPLSHPAHWQTTGASEQAGPGMLTGDSRPPDGTAYVSADYRPLATADWTDYRLRATVGGLRGTSNGVGITVRAGSDHPVSLSVGHHTASLTTDGPAGTGDRRSCRLDPSATHWIAVSVTPRRVRVSVDDETCTVSARVGGGSRREPGASPSTCATTGRSASGPASPR